MENKVLEKNNVKYLKFLRFETSYFNIFIHKTIQID